jgi:UDP-GlcNAc:undecaprenyl-phosphate GlcNAc-1-phosphate transferase
MIETTQLFSGSAAFLISLAMTPVVRLVAIRNGWVARPREDRWHKKATALMGGIAIFLGIGVSIWVADDLSAALREITFNGQGKPFVPLSIVVFSGTMIFFLLGLADDFVNLKPQTRLIGQITVASIVIFLGFRLNWFTSLTLDTMFTLIWIVGITNAFNLLDNMDGLCAGVALVAALSMAFLYGGGNPAACRLAMILAGSCAGFLVYNFNPASIFMGDCGSLVIGFATAVLSLQYGKVATFNSLSSFAVPLLILMVPILDTTLVTTIRLLSGRKASTGGRDHTSHRLVLMGLSEKQAVLFLYGIGAVSGLSAVFVSRSDSLTSPAVIIPVALSTLLMGVYLSQLRVYPEKEFSVLRGHKYTPVLIELTYKRQLAMIVLDLGLIAFSYYLSYRLRFDGKEFPYYFKVFLKSLPIIIPIKLIVFYFSGIYKGFWQYLSTRDVFLYIRSSTLATILAITGATILYRFEDFSKGVFVIDWLLTTVFLLGTRGSFRFFTETMKRKTLAGDRVVIYGAGQGGELLMREILNNKALNLNPVGFIDDDPLKTGKKIQGYSILGDFNQLAELEKKHGIRGVLLSFNGKANQDALNATQSYCKARGLFLKKFAIQLEPVDLNGIK